MSQRSMESINTETIEQLKQIQKIIKEAALDALAVCDEEMQDNGLMPNETSERAFSNYKKFMERIRSLDNDIAYYSKDVSQ